MVSDRAHDIRIDNKDIQFDAYSYFEMLILKQSGPI